MIDYERTLADRRVAYNRVCHAEAELLRARGAYNKASDAVRTARDADPERAARVDAEMVIREATRVAYDEASAQAITNPLPAVLVEDK